MPRSEKPSNLYHGTNDSHEFWESESHEWLVLRNHAERFWTAHRNHGYQFTSDTAEAAAKRIGAVLVLDRKWIGTRLGRVK